MILALAFALHLSNFYRVSDDEESEETCCGQYSDQWVSR
jgi:hypothetical protein